MDIITGIVIVTLVPLLLLSFFFRNKPGSAFGPTVCSRCGVELRGWRSSGRKQAWYRDDGKGNRIYFCVRCKNK
ncbi:hypothetical protein [Ralstonia solanacearum]|uniref:Uncharacterized protein n=1 Tax=Ralstonia solanacearum TaxID=305 RepID=A0AAE3NJ18_RALSL|nr:hypothetical protein [Ralstonia solanacearum]MBB6581566.1 hypothetical protein [Ralstonia solanacearum]MDB0524692.1 hypothetical protein [Ralstonia solanacearum]